MLQEDPRLKQAIAPNSAPVLSDADMQGIKSRTYTTPEFDSTLNAYLASQQAYIKAMDDYLRTFDSIKAANRGPIDKLGEWVASNYDNIKSAITFPQQTAQNTYAPMNNSKSVLQRPVPTTVGPVVAPTVAPSADQQTQAWWEEKAKQKKAATDIWQLQGNQ